MKGLFIGILLDLGWMELDMISAPMSWIHDLEALVPSKSINKGRNYFRSGRVEIEKASADRVEASVHGGNRYSVVIYVEIAEETVVSSCTCPYYDDNIICKHIWATLLAAQSQGRLNQIEQLADPFIETEIDYNENDEDEDFPDEPHSFQDGIWDDFTARLYRQDRSNVMRGAKAPKVAPWKQYISNLRASIPAPVSVRNEGTRRILYVADAAESVAAGGLVVRAAASRVKKNGEWGKPAFQENSIRQVSQLESEDQKVLSILSGSADVYRYGYSQHEPDSVRTRHRILQGALGVLIPMLCETERFFLKPAQTDGLYPLKWDDGSAWSLQVEVQRDDGAAEYIVKGFLVRGNSQRTLAEPLMILPGIVFFRDEAARFEDREMFNWIYTLRTAGELRVPFRQKDEFIAEIAQFPVLPSIQFPEELRIEKMSLANPPELKISSAKQSLWGTQQRLACSVTFNYGRIKLPESYRPIGIQDPGCGRYLRRDLEAETAALNRLSDLGFARVAWEKHQWELAPSRLPAAVRALVSEGWRVEAEGKLYRSANRFEMNVASGVDWFEVRGRADFEGQSVEAPQLLKAIARGEQTIRLDDGTYGLVPEDWLKRYRLVAALGKSDDGQLRFERHQAGLLDALLAEQPEVVFDEGFVRVRQELSAFAGVGAAKQAPTFNGELRDYQLEGLGWLQFLRRFGFGGCLADDMGLGKTVQVLALLDSTERSRPCLIVVPRSLIFNWKQEAARFAPRLRILDHSGAERTNQWNDIEKHDVILTTYGTLRRDASRLKDIHFDTVVLDEAQAIKNAGTENAKATRLLKADYRLALTGTPVENRLGDLWSLFEFLNPGLLGTASVFRNHIATTNGTKPDPAADDSIRVLSKALRPFLLRRTKEQVARELPPKTEQTIYCELEPEQRRLYDELREHYRAALLGRIDKIGIGKSRMQILEALLRLRQAACHPGLIDKQRAELPSAKLDSLVPQIIELVEEGHKALVFSQFTSFLDILRTRLDKEKVVYEYLDGRTRDREAHVRRFQEDNDCRLFLISLKAGGLGLNLTAAQYVFLLDPWWNPAIEAQAVDRSHRIGQKRNVFAYRLISLNTVEEKILELQKSKRELADAIITADNSMLASLSRENLELLLS